MQTERFTPGLRGNNPDYREPKMDKSRNPKKDDTSAEQVLPVLHTRPTGKLKGFMVISEMILQKYGQEAATVMALLSNTATTWQATTKWVSDETQMSMKRTKKAVQKLVLAGYITRIPVRLGGKLHGNILQSSAEGNIKQLVRSIVSYKVEEDTKEAATRQVRKRAVLWKHNSSREESTKRKTRRRRGGRGDVCNAEQTAANGRFSGASLQGYTDTITPEGAPLGTPIMLTPEEKGKNEPQSPLAFAKGVFSEFLIRADGVVIPRVADPTARAQMILTILNDEEEKECNPLTPGEEAQLLGVVERELVEQVTSIEENNKNTVDEADSGGVSVDPNFLIPRELEFRSYDLRAVRHARGMWGYGELYQSPCLWDAAQLHSPRFFPNRVVTTNNIIARAMLAPKFAVTYKDDADYDARTAKYASFHEGFQVFNGFIPRKLEDKRNAVFEVFSHEEDVELGLEHIPLQELRGDGAHLWLHTHRVGLVFLSCLRDPATELTEALAYKLVRKLRKGSVLPEDIFRLWIPAHHGIGLLSAEAAIERLSCKAFKRLETEDAIASYWTAARRMNDSNMLVCPPVHGGEFSFWKEREIYETDLLESLLNAGLTKLELFNKVSAQGHGKVLDALYACGVDAYNPGSLELRDHFENLAAVWLRAKVDGDAEASLALERWGAMKQLKRWTMCYDHGRAWLTRVHEAWEFDNLPDVAEMIGWDSHAEWEQLADLRRYAMRKSWFAFKDGSGILHQRWNRLMLQIDLKIV